MNKEDVILPQLPVFNLDDRGKMHRLLRDCVLNSITYTDCALEVTAKDAGEPQTKSDVGRAWQAEAAQGSGLAFSALRLDVGGGFV